MRRWVVAFCLLGFVSHAAAQDFETPTLRGSSPFIPAAPKYTRWAGFYVGGQMGQSSTEMNFENATEKLIAYILRTTALENEEHPSTWGVLGKSNPTGQSYGGFIGYNSQWSDVIIGLDFHYNASSFHGVAPVSPITRAVNAGGNDYIATVDGSASMRITDYGALRFRAGWVAGNFLPYATVGLAFGRADITRSARVSGTETPEGGGTPFPFVFSTTEVKNKAFIYGWSAGGGVDVFVVPNFFLRGEIEYMSFTEIEGVMATIATARVGAGFKF
jgi:outer membrane immunogenic protein